MKKYLLLFSIILSAANAAHAAVLTFDDITTTFPPSVIQDGYGGFNWPGMNVMNTNNFPNSGYQNGTVSGNNVAFNGFGFGGSILSAAGHQSDFDFVGAYFAAAWSDGLNIVVEGWDDGALVFSKTIVASYSSPTWFLFNFLSIDELKFSSSGGVDNPNDLGFGNQFALDDFTYNQPVNPVPVPAAVWLFGSGIAGLLGFKRRKIQADSLSA